MGPKPHWGHGAGNLKKGSKENDTQVVAIPTATKPKKRKKEEKQNVRWIVSTNLCAKAVFSSSKKLKFTRKKKVKRMPTLPTNGRSSFEHLSFVHVKRRKKLQFRLMKTRKKKTQPCIRALSHTFLWATSSLHGRKQCSCFSKRQKQKSMSTDSKSKTAGIC